MRLSIPLSALAVLVFASLALGQATKVYVSESKLGDPKLYKMDPDGSNKTELGVLPTIDWLPFGLAIDPAGTKLYYTHANQNAALILRINLDGSGREVLLGGVRDARSLKIDWSNDKMYWTDRVAKIIYRANTDGTGIQPLVTGTDTLDRLDLDLTNGKIYFGNITQKQIERCDLDGSNREVVLGTTDVNQCGSVAVDVAGGKLYWLDRAVQTNYVARVNLDGSGFEILVDFPNTTSGLGGIELDLAGGMMYWTDESPTAERGLWSATLDGANATRLHATPDSWTPGAPLVNVDPTAILPCMAGNVNAGAGPVTDVLFVNGSAGGANREVTVTDGVEILSTIVKPPALGNGRFVIHGNLGRPSEGGVTPLPRNIGDTCFPVLLRDGAMPSIIANSARNYDLVGASMFFGASTADPPKAPATILQRTSDPNLAPGTIVTLQGAIFDPGSAAPRGASVTNGVTFVVQ